MNDIDNEALELANAITAQAAEQPRRSKGFSLAELVSPVQLKLAQALVGMRAKLTKRDEQHAEVTRQLAETERSLQQVTLALDLKLKSLEAKSVAVLFERYASETEELQKKLAESEASDARRQRMIGAIERVLRGEGW